MQWQRVVHFYRLRIRNAHLCLSTAHTSDFPSRSWQYLVPSLADAGQATSTSHLLGALHRSNRQGGMRSGGRCEREPTGPGNPSARFNSYHYHYHCHPNPTTHSTPVIDIFTPPIRLAVMWYGHRSLFFSISLLRLSCKRWIHKYTFLFIFGSLHVIVKHEALLKHGTWRPPS
jgi:hypothetical protein